MIEEPEIVEEILMKMPNLKVLYLFKNPCVKKMTQYRKNLINKIPTLTYLDDRPVFKDDRRTAEAFCRGGFEEEKDERNKIRQEKKDANDLYHKNFQAMMAKAKAEKLADDRKKMTEEELAANLKKE
jgi:dynein assembly factor 1, axonemal